MALPIVAVVTGNSNSGAQAVRDLMDKYPGKTKVRAVFRSEEKAKPFLEAYGSKPDFFEVVTGVDASSLESLAPAYAGASYAVVVTPHDAGRGMQDDAELTANMINAAVAAGVKHIAYVGSFTVNCPDVIKIISSRFVPSEALLKTLGETKGLRWTSLRGGFFNQNFAGMLGAGIRAGEVKFPNFVLPPVDPRDMGRVAASIFASDDPSVHHGKAYEISGPEKLSFEETVAKIGKVLGKEIRFETLSTEALEHFPPFLKEIFEQLSKGPDAIPFSDITKQVAGQHTTLDEWLHEHKDMFTGEPTAH